MTKQERYNRLNALSDAVYIVLLEWLRGFGTKALVLAKLDELREFIDTHFE